MYKLHDGYASLKRAGELYDAEGRQNAAEKAELEQRVLGANAASQHAMGLLEEMDREMGAKKKPIDEIPITSTQVKRSPLLDLVGEKSDELPVPPPPGTPKNSFSQGARSTAHPTAKQQQGAARPGDSPQLPEELHHNPGRTSLTLDLGGAPSQSR